MSLFAEILLSVAIFLILMWLFFNYITWSKKINGCVKKCRSCFGECDSGCGKCTKNTDFSFEKLFAADQVMIDLTKDLYITIQSFLIRNLGIVPPKNLLDTL